MFLTPCSNAKCDSLKDKIHDLPTITLMHLIHGCPNVITINKCGHIIQGYLLNMAYLTMSS